MKYHFIPYNFGGIEKQDFKKARVVVLPVPYDSTASFISGSKMGPKSIIYASRFLDELFDPKGKGNLLGIKDTEIFTLDEIEINKNSAREAIESIEEAVYNEIIKYNKIPLVLGGEHSITLGVVRALRKKHKNFSILHFDAHTDLIDELENTKYSHGSVMRRVYDLKIPFVQIGIRNLNSEVKEFVKRKKIKSYLMPEVPSANEVLDSLTEKVYISFDLDAFDPSILPAVGTPEPGGLLWQQVIDIIKAVSKKKRIIGCDVVELCPIPGSVQSEFTAAKLAYHLIVNANDSQK
ncbi:agmatinase [Candidatus Parcubacteria bacterium]|nr:MAG: agmatinase [Candidatus Parcubacteria bacterium]